MKGYLKDWEGGEVDLARWGRVGVAYAEVERLVDQTFDGTAPLADRVLRPRG